MPPRLLFQQASRALASRGAPRHFSQPLPFRIVSRRTYAESEKPPPPEQKPGPNQDQLPHVSEEAAMTADITGEKGPEVDQGTPIQDILKRDKDGQEKAPQVMQDKIPASDKPKGSRGYSTMAMAETPSSEILPPVGHKFPLPELPLASNANIKYRYDPVVKQVTALLMRDGKLSVAQRNMSYILAHLQTAAPPTLNPERPLMPGAPPPNHLPLNPILYLTLAIDSVAPLMRIRSQRGAAGGGVALQIPVALKQNQRRRKAVEWILDAVDKKQSRGSGRGQFALRFAEEVVAVVEGRSGIWEKRSGVHKLGVSSRANLSYGRRRR